MLWSISANLTENCVSQTRLDGLGHYQQLNKLCFHHKPKQPLGQGFETTPITDDLETMDRSVLMLISGRLHHGPPVHWWAYPNTQLLLGFQHASLTSYSQQLLSRAHSKQQANPRHERCSQRYTARSMAAFMTQLLWK